MVAINPRFHGIERLYGRDGLAYLQNSHVAVIGLGGVGSWAAEALARSGVGRLTLVDLDEVCISNINRQLVATTSHIGQSKAAIMRARLQDIHPQIQVNVIEDFLTPDNVTQILTTDVDGVIDAIDSVAPKTAMIAHCKRQKLPIVVCGGAGARVDPTRIRVSDLSRCEQDPLLARTRKRLRQHYGFSRNPKRIFSVPAVYSTEPRRFVDAEGRLSAQRPSTLAGDGLSCDIGLGACTMVTGGFGFAACSRLIELLLRRHESHGAG